MNAVVFYSNTGESQRIAKYFADKLGYVFTDMETSGVGRYQNLVLVFPVHCQNIPSPVKTFLKTITVKNLTVIATYGKMCPGNVLYEVQKNYQKNMVVGAYIPTKHAYLSDDTSFEDFDKLDVIIDKIKEPSYVKIPPIYKNPLADIFPKWRSQMGLKIRKNSDCNGCNICGRGCALGAIKVGKTNGKCIRCLKCVENCPNKALQVKLRLPLRLYLRKKKSNRVIIYI